MSDFVGLRETFLKACTESQNDTSDDDVLKELPSIFLTTRAKFFDEDDYECNRAVLVRLKLEGKLEHKFNTSTAFDYITSTRDALEQCKRDLYVNAGLEQDDEKYRAMEALLKGDPSSMSIHDALLLAINGLARTNDDDIKRVFEIGESFLLSKMKRVPDTPYLIFFHGTYKDRLEKCNAQLKVKSYAESKIEAREEELAAAKAELAVCKEQLNKAKDDLLESKDEQLKLSMELVASKDELAKAKQASKGKPLACVN